MEDKRIEEIKDFLYNKYIRKGGYCPDVEVKACNAYAMLCMAQNSVANVIIKEKEEN